MESSKREKVIINVSGQRFRTWRSTLRKHPDTLLGNDNMLTCFYDDKRQEYFLDRDPEVFRHILRYYQVGKLHISHEDCLELFYDELKFYGIPTDTVHECCWGDCYEMSLKILKYGKKTGRKQGSTWGKVRGNQFRRIRKTIHNFLEQRQDSFWERLFQYVVGVFIFLSIVCATVATIRCEEDTKTWEQCHHRFFEISDIIFMCVFSFEYALRLFSTPCLRLFFKNKFNLFDLAAISPFYIDLARRWFTNDNVIIETDIWDVFRVLRGIRILKLARHSLFMQKFGRRLKKAFTDLGFLYFAFVLANIFFASCLYTVEVLQGKNTYQSIPDTMWFTVVTMMTLGYGDSLPKTIMGRIMAAFYCLFGIIILALPVPILQDVGS
ncbi:potassium voltage-gated channel protein Shal-like [Dendronephthya gigantea]|uniref:potassium voltage-gated channel protein Shal-like n=1 Tax=Dendronephthya gigantea TaxID=151771 RepID=UPI00106B1F3A|nr:potassium voltage-gated channel protein Shal-like [Dendronephthya gigantea]XP_028398241.1 potassium voltage-gated channel protein Shal-like [Dendronephthya gigantea]